MIWPRTPISAGSFSERKPAHRRRPPRLPADARTALNGLQTLRTNPGAAREDREKYASFFGDIAERLYLTGEQARWALRCLGAHRHSGHAGCDGADAVVPLPTKSARVSLRHLARQLREDPLDLILMLAGARLYQAQTG